MSKVLKLKSIIELDENHVPENYYGQQKMEVLRMKKQKQYYYLIWDANAKETLRILDLWTKDMPVDEMKIFFHQTLVAMTDTFGRATGDEKMAATMQDFCDYFRKLELKIKHPLIDCLKS